MNDWEKALDKVIRGEPRVPHRYELRPGEKGPAIYCSTCSRIVTPEATVFVDEIVEEAMAHEKDTHPRKF